MAMLACLANLRKQGTITAEQAERFRKEFDRLNKAYRKTMAAPVAAQQASQATMSALTRQAMHTKRQKLLLIASQRDIWADHEMRMARGEPQGQIARALMEPNQRAPGKQSVEGERAGFQKLARARLNKFFQRYKPNIAGQVRRPGELREVVRELRGEATNNPHAKAIAATLADTFEWLRQLYNAAGGAIPKMADWGLPQSHDATEIAKAGLDKWRDYIKTKLDPTKMIDQTTGKPFASEAELDDALEQVWKNIVSEGLDGRVPGTRSGSSFAERRLDHRFLVFENADAWLDYNERFGTGDPWTAIIDHIDSMTRDIAAMRVLGPDPAATIRWYMDMIEKQELPGKAGGAAGKAKREGRRGMRAMQRMWRYYNGELTAVLPEGRHIARFFEGAKHWNVMAKLGKAVLAAAPTDPVFKAFTAKFNGLPVMRTIGDYFAQVGAAGREAAREEGLLASDAITRVQKLWREHEGINLVEIFRRGADALLRSTGLTAITAAGKQSTGISFLRQWARDAHTEFGDLPELRRRSLERYGITEDDWNRLRAQGPKNRGGIKLLSPADLARSGDPKDLATALKFLALIDHESKFATPGELLRAQSRLAFGGEGSPLQHGTVLGGLAQSVGQFKGYSLIALMTHLQRAVYGARTPAGKLSYASLPIFLTLMGYVAYALRELAAGRDVPDPENPETWARSFAIGGGAGMAGDVVSSGVEGKRGTGGGLLSYVAGPLMGSMIDPAFELTVGNIGQAAQGDNTNVGREAVRFLRQNTPGSNSWYLGPAMQRLMFDQLQEMADPNFRASVRQQMRDARTRGAPFYWRPGETSPDRAPTIAGDSKP